MLKKNKKWITLLFLVCAMFVTSSTTNVMASEISDNPETAVTESENKTDAEEQDTPTDETEVEGNWELVDEGKTSVEQVIFEKETSTDTPTVTGPVAEDDTEEGTIESISLKYKGVDTVGGILSSNTKKKFIFEYHFKTSEDIVRLSELMNIKFKFTIMDPRTHLPIVVDIEHDGIYETEKTALTVVSKNEYIFQFGLDLDSFYLNDTYDVNISAFKFENDDEIFRNDSVVSGEFTIDSSLIEKISSTFVYGASTAVVVNGANNQNPETVKSEGQSVFHFADTLDTSENTVLNYINDVPASDINVGNYPINAILRDSQGRLTNFTKKASAFYVGPKTLIYTLQSDEFLFDWLSVPGVDLAEGFTVEETVNLPIPTSSLSISQPDTYQYKSKKTYVTKKPERNVTFVGHKDSNNFDRFKVDLRGNDFRGMVDADLLLVKTDPISGIETEYSPESLYPIGKTTPASGEPFYTNDIMYSRGDGLVTANLNLIMPDYDEVKVRVKLKYTDNRVENIDFDYKAEPYAGPPIITPKDRDAITIYSILRVNDVTKIVLNIEYRENWGAFPDITKIKETKAFVVNKRTGARSEIPRTQYLSEKISTGSIKRIQATVYVEIPTNDYDSYEFETEVYDKSNSKLPPVAHYSYTVGFQNKKGSNITITDVVKKNNAFATLYAEVDNYDNKPFNLYAANPRIQANESIVGKPEKSNYLVRSAYSVLDYTQRVENGKLFLVVDIDTSSTTTIKPSTFSDSFIELYMTSDDYDGTVLNLAKSGNPDYYVGIIAFKPNETLQVKFPTNTYKFEPYYESAFNSLVKIDDDAYSESEMANGFNLGISDYTLGTSSFNKSWNVSVSLSPFNDGAGHLVSNSTMQYRQKLMILKDDSGTETLVEPDSDEGLMAYRELISLTSNGQSVKIAAATNATTQQGDFVLVADPSSIGLKILGNSMVKNRTYSSTLNWSLDDTP